MVNPSTLVTQLGELGTVGLILALVLLFVVAFKVLEMVFQTVLVAALSGGFYFVLSYYFQAVTFSLNSLLFFAFLGGSLYTGYYLFIQGYSILSFLVSLPIKLARNLVDVFSKLGERVKEKRGREEQD